MNNKLRKRGAQPGNQNAHKHGFFSGNMTPCELCRYLDILRRGKTDAPMAAFQVKFESAVRASPLNDRIVREAAKIICKFHDDGLSAPERRALKRVVVRLLDISRAQIIAAMAPEYGVYDFDFNAVIRESVAAFEDTLRREVEKEEANKIKQQTNLLKLRNKCRTVLLRTKRAQNLDVNRDVAP